MLAHQRLGCCDFEFPRTSIGVEGEGFFIKLCLFFGS